MYCNMLAKLLDEPDSRTQPTNETVHPHDTLSHTVSCACIPMPGCTLCVHAWLTPECSQGPGLIKA